MNIFFGRPVKIDQNFLYMLVWVLYFYVALLKVKNTPENTSCTNSRIQLSISKVFCTCHLRLSEQCTESQATFGTILRISILFIQLSFSKKSSTVPLSL
jgi:hypothetical protein